MDKHIRSPSPNALIRAWNAVVAWFLCVPSYHAYAVPHRHWIKHSRLVAFVFIVVLPLSGISWAHLIGLMVGPCEHLLELQTFAGAFMMLATCLFDSMLCGTLGEKHFTWVSFAVFCFRWLFAMCAASSLSLGAVLLLLGSQLDLVRADQALSAQEADRTRIARLNDLDGLSRVVDAAKSEVVNAKTMLATAPSELASLERDFDACQASVRELEEENDRRLPPLEGTATRLRTQLQQASSKPNSAADRGLPMLQGALKEDEAEIARLRSRVSRKSAECQVYKTRANAVDQAHKIQASRVLDDAQAANTAALKQQAEAARNAGIQLEALNRVTEKAWSRNLSAQISAAWSIVHTQMWAAILCAVTYVVVLVIELSPVLGKIALRGGALDQLGEVEEEAARQDFLTKLQLDQAEEEAERQRDRTRLAEIQAREEATRSVLAEEMRQRAELESIKRTGAAVFDESDALHRRGEKLRDTKEDRDVVNEVFQAGRRRMVEKYKRYVDGFRDR